MHAQNPSGAQAKAARQQEGQPHPSRPVLLLGVQQESRLGTWRGTANPQAQSGRSRARVGVRASISIRNRTKARARFGVRVRAKVRAWGQCQYQDQSRVRVMTRAGSRSGSGPRPGQGKGQGKVPGPEQGQGHGQGQGRGQGQGGHMLLTANCLEVEKTWDMTKGQRMAGPDGRKVSGKTHWLAGWPAGSRSRGGQRRQPAGKAEQGRWPVGS